MDKNYTPEKSIAKTAKVLNSPKRLKVAPGKIVGSGKRASKR